MLCETEKKKKSNEKVTKFELWTLKDIAIPKTLVFKIPKNFINISQKSGNRTTVS
jgi:hypothetical protein